MLREEGDVVRGAEIGSRPREMGKVRRVWKNREGVIGTVQDKSQYF